MMLWTINVLSTYVYSHLYLKLSVMTVRGNLQTLKHENRETVKSICVIKVTRRYSQVCSKAFSHKQGPKIYDGRMELDSHADTFVAGRNCMLMHYTERVCDVMPYSDDYAAKTGVPIVQVATGYTNAAGERFILIINEAIWMPYMTHSLANPNQFRDYGTKVQDNPYDGRPMTIEAQYEGLDFIECLRLQGTNIFLDTWTPSPQDLSQYPRVVLTSPKPWDPDQVQFPGLSENEMHDIEYMGSVGISTINCKKNHQIVDTRDHGDPVQFDDPYYKPIKIFDIQIFNRRIMKSVVVPTIISEGPLSEDKLRDPNVFLSYNRHSNTTPEDLSEVWNISVEQEKLTLDATTQYHARSAIMPLSRRYRTDLMFEPKRLWTDMGTDTMDPRCQGLHGDKMCQVFGNKQMFVAAYPTPSKKSVDIDEALKKFITDFGAPTTMTMDGSKEQTSRNSAFNGRLRRNRITPIICNPHRPNKNPAETVIRELRKKWYRAIFQTNCPKSLWNYGLPHFASIMQMTATHAAGLNGQTPLGALLGETPDISHLLDFGWYDFIWFKENAGLDVPQLGRFLGIDDSVSNLISYWILPA